MYGWALKLPSLPFPPRGGPQKSLREVISLLKLLEDLEFRLDLLDLELRLLFAFLSSASMPWRILLEDFLSDDDDAGAPREAVLSLLTAEARPASCFFKFEVGFELRFF